MSDSVNYNLLDVRRALTKHIGSKITVRSNLGRHKYNILEGILTETYPCVFLVEVTDNKKDSVKTLSYSYSDIITNDVQLRLVQ